VSENSKERLLKARLALQNAQNREGLQEFQIRQIDNWNAGLYKLGPTPPEIIYPLAKLFKKPLWFAVLNINNIGWEAAAKAGWDLSRTVIVHCNNNINNEILSLLLESFGVIITNDTNITPRLERTLTAKARKLGRLIFIATPQTHSHMNIHQGGMKHAG